MLLAHLSDLHLGYRAYDRAERGQNVRERDVAEVFRRAVDGLIGLQPDLVLIAGDVFDRPDPSPGALVTLTRGLDALGSALPDTPVLMISGARDTSRRPGDPGALTALESFPGVEAATGSMRSVSLLDGRVHVCMLPYRACLLEPSPAPEPDPAARFNLVVAYGRHDDRAWRGVRLPVASWDYVALGSEHVARQIAPHIHYSGSLERVGPAPWAEAAAEKGFLTYDLESRSSVFHPLPTRPVVALAPIRVPGGDSGALRERLREVTGEVPGGIDGKIVHLTLRGIAPNELLGLQGDLFASLRARALHLAVEVEEPRERPWQPPRDLRLRLRDELDAAGLGTAQHLSAMENALDRAEARSGVGP